MKKTRILAMFGVSAIAATALVISNAAPATAAPGVGKIVICHIEQDDLEPTGVVISISNNAWTAHEAHGDYATDLILGSVCPVL